MNTRMFLIGIVSNLLAVFSAAHSADLREQRFHFAIAKGSLPSALEQFAVQTGLQVMTQPNVTGSKTVEVGPFVRHATVDEAMQHLLRGTDLWYEWQDEITIRLWLISEQRALWSSGGSTAKEASDTIHGLGGAHYETGPCGDLLVGPAKSDEPITAEEFWIKLIEPHCRVIRKPDSDIQPGSIEGLSVTGETEHDFSIAEMPRMDVVRRISEQTGTVIGYLSSDDAEERAIVGPIRGQMSVNEALQLAMRDSVLRVRWAADNIASVEPAYKIRAYADMSKCPCNFGLPEWRPLKNEHVTVIGSRLPSIEDYIPGRTVVFEKREIEATGASSIPDFLRHATQLPYMRPKGYRLSGAQFAELRGLDPRYTLVLINGTRADVSASDLMTSAFDLQNIPLNAVERIEISAASPSLVHGMDAIGGIVNIVLRDNVTTPVADARYGTASGGARERIGTVAAGTATERTKTVLFIDYFEVSELLGAKRDRWANMDYTRYGGPDRRSRTAAPPNVYTLDGENLPGLDAPEAAVSILPSGEIAFRPGETNLMSSLAMQAIVPAMRRASVTGLAAMNLGSAKLSGDVTFVQRHAHFQMGAEIVPGFIMSSQHPQNPFDVPLAVDAALTGLPPRATDSRSELLRGVVKLDGPLGTWRYHTFLRRSQEQASSTRVNFVNPAALMSGLAADGEGVLNILSARPGELSRASLLAPRESTSDQSGGSQVSARIAGPLPVVRADATLGVEYRTEYARFDRRVGTVERHEASTFGMVTLPLGERIDVTYGTRIDDFSHLERIRRQQWGFNWKPVPKIELRAAYNEAFHAPSLYDLYLPRSTTPVPLFDARRQEVTSVSFVGGGNPTLAPTSGTSSTIGITVEADNAFTASVDLWRIRMRDHVSAVSPLALLTHESEAIAGRVIRDAPTALDQQAGRPGRLLALDTSRANIGAVDARGVDLSIQKQFETAAGTFASRLDLTYTDAFRHGDLPIRDAPMRDRAGIASVMGTIPRWRGAGSFGYSGYGWELSVLARYHSSYTDYSVATSTISNRDIPARALWDFTLSKNVGAHIKLTIGVSDVLNRAPPYAEVSDPLGVDISQGDLTGRTAFIRVNGSM